MCRKVIRHCPKGGGYWAVAVNSEGLLAVTDDRNKCVHLLTEEGTLVRSIKEGVIGGWLFGGVAFDLKGNVWVTVFSNNKVVKLSQNGRRLQTIHQAGIIRRNKLFSLPRGVSVSTEGMVYICDSNNRRVTVHDENGKFLFAFGSEGSDPGCFAKLRDIAFGSDGLMYVSDKGTKRVSVWSKEGAFMREFQPKYAPTCIAATSDNHLLITSHSSNIVMVYTLEGELIHEFGGLGVERGRFNLPSGICVDDNGVVYIVDRGNNRVLVY